MEPNPPMLIEQPKTSNKWKITAIIFIVLSVLLIGLSTFLLIDKLNNKDEKEQAETCQENKTDEENEDSEEVNTFAISEWNIEFTIPDSLTDIRYVIENAPDYSGATAYLVARPSDGSLQYPSDISVRIKDEALAILTRSTLSIIDGNVNGSVEGKKVGNYYFYTAWSFSGLASGVGIPSLFDVDIDNPANSLALSNVFHELNDMLQTIQVAN